MGAQQRHRTKKMMTSMHQYRPQGYIPLIPSKPQRIACYLVLIQTFLPRNPGRLQEISPTQMPVPGPKKWLLLRSHRRGFPIRRPRLPPFRILLNLECPGWNLLDRRQNSKSSNNRKRNVTLFLCLCESKGAPDVTAVPGKWGISTIYELYVVWLIRLRYEVSCLERGFRRWLCLRCNASQVSSLATLPVHKR